MEADPCQESRINTNKTGSTVLPSEQDGEDFEVGILQVSPTVDHSGMGSRRVRNRRRAAKARCYSSRSIMQRSLKIIRPSCGVEEVRRINTATQIGYTELQQ